MKDEVSVNLGIKYVKTKVKGMLTITGTAFYVSMKLNGKTKEEIAEYTKKKETEPLYDYPYALTTGFARKRKG